MLTIVNSREIAKVNVRVVEVVAIDRNKDEDLTKIVESWCMVGKRAFGEEKLGGVLEAAMGRLLTS